MRLLLVFGGMVWIGYGPTTWVTLLPEDVGGIWDALSIGLPALTLGAVVVRGHLESPHLRMGLDGGGCQSRRMKSRCTKVADRSPYKGCETEEWVYHGRRSITINGL